jgi:hypothetical protein
MDEDSWGLVDNPDQPVHLPHPPSRPKAVPCEQQQGEHPRKFNCACDDKHEPLNMKYYLLLLPVMAPLLQQVTGCYSFVEQPNLGAKVKC